MYIFNKLTTQLLRCNFQVLSYDSMSTVNMLDDKIAFLEECQRMSLPVPEFHQISSVEHVDMLRKQGKGSFCFNFFARLKYLNLPD